MWTERLKTINNFDNITAYLDSIDYFHDYRLGNVEICNDSIKICVEEDTENKHNENAHIWDFTFTEYSDFKADVDCIIPSYINEISVEDNYVMFSLNNGFISLLCKKISLGIPKE